MPHKHIAILIDNSVNTKALVNKIHSGSFVALADIKGSAIAELSQAQIARFIEEEEIHDHKILTKDSAQSLQTMSSGERKKALLTHILEQNPSVLLAVNPYDSLDKVTQTYLKDTLTGLKDSLSILQIVNRQADILPFTEVCYQLEEEILTPINKETSPKDQKATLQINQIPLPLKPITVASETLVNFNNVSVAFNGKTVLNQINWTIKQGEFWQLFGPNGSGKSTLLSLITGDGHKGYGQDLTLFGHKKGSGESVWELKRCIGYFSPAMVDRFKGYHTLEHMLVSGLHDSVGLYVKPPETHQQKAMEWLRLLGLDNKKGKYFNDQSIGTKRLLMTARAMIKHPPLLILDEPTVGLDDQATALFVALVNAYAAQSNSAIIYVSHREEPHLLPEKNLHLQPMETGSVVK